VLARPTYSNVLYNQMVSWNSGLDLTMKLGRGTRTSPQTGKTDCLVIDLVGNSDRHAEGVKPMLSRSVSSPGRRVLSLRLMMYRKYLE
jgi:type I site-specific restriction endonuclease